MYILYVLMSQAQKRTYIGITHDVVKRIKEHNTGYVRSTQAYRPYTLVHTETYLTKCDARKREIELKKNAHKKELLFRSLGLR